MRLITDQEYLDLQRLRSQEPKLYQALREIANMAHRAWEDKSTIVEIFKMIEMKAKHPIPEDINEFAS